MYNKSVLTSQETHFVTIAMTNRLLLFRDNRHIYCENHMKHINILSSVWVVSATCKTGFGVDDWIYWHLVHSTGTTGNTAISLIYTLHSSPLHTHSDSLFSLILSRQRIYNSLTVTSNHIWILLSLPNSTANSEDSTQFNSKLISRHVGVPKLDSSLHIMLLNTSLYNHFARITQETQSLLLRRRVYWSVT
jgi:hypothetical protein